MKDYISILKMILAHPDGVDLVPEKIFGAYVVPGDDLVHWGFIMKITDGNFVNVSGFILEDNKKKDFICIFPPRKSNVLEDVLREKVSNWEDPLQDIFFNKDMLALNEAIKEGALADAN